MNSMPTTRIGIITSSSIVLLPLGLQCGLHGFQFGVDRFGGLQLGNLFFEALGPRHAESVGTALGKVGASFENLEAAERVFGPAAVEQLAGACASDRTLEPSGDRILPGACFAKLVLKLGDVAFIAFQRVVDDLDFFAQALAHVGSLLALDERGLGKVLALLRQCELRLLGPA